jgi:hypothetical protein
MADENKLALKTLASTMEELDIRYMETDEAGKLAMKDELDEAFLAFSRARLRLLQNRVLCNTSCIQQMSNIRQEIHAAAETQTLIQGIIRWIGFLVKL